MYGSSHRRKRLGSAGHTLMELMVVMVLLGIAAWLLVPLTAHAYARFRLRLAADSILRIMQQAKNRAVFEGRTYLVVFPDANSRERELILTREDGFAVVHFIFPTDISLSARQQDDNWSADVGSIAFYPDGTADGVQLTLRNASNFISRIQLDPLTANGRALLPSEVEP